MNKLITVFLLLIAASYLHGQSATLTSPTNGATNIGQSPTFTWTHPNVASVQYFILQVSTSPTFSSIYRSATVYGLSEQITQMNRGVTYYWRVYAYISSGNQPVSSVRSFSIPDLPEANFSVNKATVCTTDSVKFSSALSKNAYSYKWTFHGGIPLTSNDPNPVVHYTTPGTHDVYLEVTNAVGMHNKLEFDYITVLQGATGGMSVFSGSEKKCAQDTVELRGYSQNSTSFNWSNGDTGKIIKTTAFGTISLTIKYGTCENTFSKNIIQDTLKLGLSYATHQLCLNDSIKITANGGYTSYKWSDNSSDTFVYTKKPGLYFVTATKANSCPAKDSVNIVKAYPTKKIIVSGFNPAMCSSDSIQLSTPDGFKTTTWSNNASASNIKIFNPGTYSALFTDSANCRISDTVSLSFTRSYCLNGVYTIGGASPDFATLKTAIDSLAKGTITGPVTFRLRPGTYIGKNKITKANGISWDKPVTFESETGNAKDVLLTFDDTVLYTKDVSYLRFRNLSFQSIKKEKAVFFSGSAIGRKRGIHFIGNRVLGIVNKSDYGTSSGWNERSSTHMRYIDSVIIDSNTFEQSLSNLNLQDCGYVRITNNNATAYFRNFTVYDCDSAVIANNTTLLVPDTSKVNSATVGYNGIEVNRTSTYVIRANKITVLESKSASKNGLEVSSGHNIKFNYITNNVVHSESRGIRLNKAYKIALLHNNIYSLSYALAISDADYTTEVSANNISRTYKESTIDPFIYIDDTSNLKFSNNNYAYLDTTVKNFAWNGNGYKSYNDWQKVQKFDMDSRRVNTNYVAGTDLYTNNILLDSSAPWRTEVQTDVSGKIRNTTRTDIGAYEISDAKDLSIDSVFMPVRLCADSAIISVKITNRSIVEILGKNTSFSINYSINNSVPFSVAKNFTKDGISFATGEKIVIASIKSTVDSIRDLKIWITYTGDVATANDTIIHTIKLLQLPSVDFSSQGICRNSSTNFTANAPNAIAYLWTFPDATTSKIDNPSKVFSTAGNKLVKLEVTANNGCTNNISKTISISDLPSVVVNKISDSLIASVGTSYQWYLNDNPISGAEFQTHVIKASGNYKVKVTNGAGCSSISQNVFYSAVAIHSEKATYNILAYPNPVGSILTIDVENLNSPATYQLLDYTGRVVTTGTLHQNANSINVESLSSGAYFIYILIGNSHQTIKIVKN